MICLISHCHHSSVYIYYPFIGIRATLNPKSVLVCITSPTLSPPSVLWTSNTTFPGRADSGLTFRDISLQVQTWCDITCIELYRESTGCIRLEGKSWYLCLWLSSSAFLSAHMVSPAWSSQNRVKSQNIVLSLYKISMPLSAPPCGWTLLGGLETSTKATAVNIKTGTTTTTTYYNDDGNRHDQPTTTKYQIPPPSALSCTSFLSFLHSPPIKLSHTGWHSSNTWFLPFHHKPRVMVSMKLLDSLLWPCTCLTWRLSQSCECLVMLEGHMGHEWKW